MSQRLASSSLNAARRAADLRSLAAGEPVDVLVIGGGITGAGVALDAASRGLSVALLERGDLAQGTSRFSSKLVHGGLRYLYRGDFGLAWESAVERALLMRRIAPHLVSALPFVIPLDSELQALPAAVAELGLFLGDAMRVASRLRSSRLPPPGRISAREAQRLAPALSLAPLRGALLYWDGQLCDDARLVVAVARTAATHGAHIVTRAAVSALTDGGAAARDELTGERFDVRAHHVVNATGVWAGRLATDVRLAPSRGSHLLVDAACLGHPRAVINVPVPDRRGSFVFAVPRPDGLVMIGLTDVAQEGEIPDEPRVSADEEAQLLSTLNRALDVELTSADVVGRFAGLRPLLARGEGATAELSRRHAVLEDHASGLLTVVGGKLTTYRRMAQDAVDRIAARPGVRAGPCRTRRLALVGAGPLPPEAPAALVGRYGSEAPCVAALADGSPELLEPLAPGAPALGVELRFAVEHELALTVDDLLDRRTRVGLVDAWRAAAVPAATALAPELATGARAARPRAAPGSASALDAHGVLASVGSTEDAYDKQSGIRPP
jgi:glycerol-3-phosphate dehydrogenase